MLRDLGILYAPDYVINGGGIIRVAAQIENWSDAEVQRRVLGIADTLSAIFTRAAKDGEATSVIADRMAEERIARGRAPAAKAAE
jgi:leucine dehydrogenase